MIVISSSFSGGYRVVNMDDLFALCKQRGLKKYVIRLDFDKLHDFMELVFE